MATVGEAFVFVGVFCISYIVLKLFGGKGKGGRLRYPPSLPSLPLVGSLPFMRGFDNIAEFLLKKSEELGPIFIFKAGSKLILTLNSRDAIDEALVNRSYIFSGRDPLFTEGIVNPRTKGLISMNTSPEWKKYHHLSLSILKEFGFGSKSAMEDRILMEVEAMRDHILTKKGQAFDPHEMAMLATFNVVFNICFGRRRDYELGESELAHQIALAFVGLDIAFDMSWIVRYIPYYREKLKMYVKSEERIQEIITEELSKRQVDGEEDCFVRRYIEKLGPGYDCEQLKFTLRDLVAAGSDTTASTLLWSLFTLANHPEIQERLQNEIDSVIPRDRLPSTDDQPRLPHVAATILEILRWKTLVICSLPRMTLDDCEIGGYFVPGGTMIWPNLYAAHMDPRIWKDPEVFRPERFLDDKNNVINKSHVIPFCVGRRSCLGEPLARQELFLFLAGLLQRFIIRPPEGQDSIKVETLIGLLVIPSPFTLRMIPRE